jgi:hypothetical protein
MIHNVGVVMIMVLTVSVLMVMVMMTIIATGACVGLQRTDRVPNELQQIGSNPVPHPAL